MAKYQTVKQVCDDLAITRQYVYKLIAQKKLPAIRLGHTFRIPVDAVEKFERDRQVV